MIEHGNHTFRLMDQQEVEKIPDNAMEDNKYYHFITPIKYIIEDYDLFNNIRIYLPEYGECKKLYSEKPQF